MSKILRDDFKDNSIGKNIKRLRKAKKWTQKHTIIQIQLEGSEMHQTTLSKIESGSRNIKVSDLKSLKRIFNVSFDEFFKD